MANTNRDDFDPKTKDLLAKTVGYKCSHPCCRIATIGSKEGEIGTVNLGEAAHIYAAAPGGKSNAKIMQIGICFRTM